jgi:snurportin-1
VLQTEFRFIWLQSQLAEISVNETSKHNKFRFIPLTFKLYSAISLEEVMTGSPPFPEVMDGVLFYHREAHYTAGSCPLVVWLLPFMLPEVLGVPVCDVHRAQQPANYPGHLEFVQHFESQTRHARKQEYKERKAASRFAMQETSMESQNSEDIEIIE